MSFDVPGEYLVVSYALGTGITAPPSIASNTGVSVFKASTAAVINAAASAGVISQAVHVASVNDVFTWACTATTMTSLTMLIAPYTY